MRLLLALVASACFAQQTDWVSQIRNMPFADARKYNFTPLSPGGSVAIGSNTKTLAPCPLGVSGTDTNHYLYISGGTGTAESVLITGGTCTSGANTGTIIFTAANTHSGAWKLQSASSGIKEAANFISNAGTVLLPGSPLTIHKNLILPTAVSMHGQGFSTTGHANGSILTCDAAASPCVQIVDGLGTATGQGFGLHDSYRIYGSGSGIGLQIGSATQTGSYLRITNIYVDNVDSALYHYRGNFVNYFNSVFAGNTRALVLPSSGGGEHQPTEFHGCLLSVPSGSAIQMDDSGFATNVMEFYGGQISGTITGNDIYMESFGTHYEPNETNVGIINATGSRAIIHITGGLISVHGTALTSIINVAGSGGYQLKLVGSQVQADVGMTVTNFVNFSTSLLGSLWIEDNDFALAGTISNVYNISKATLDAAVTMYVKQPIAEGNTGIAAGSTVTFTQNSYPERQHVLITGATVGGTITAVAGLTPYSTGILSCQANQTWTAGATIGNTITTTAGLPYTYVYDGTHIWIN